MSNEHSSTTQSPSKSSTSTNTRIAKNSNSYDEFSTASNSHSNDTLRYGRDGSRYNKNNGKQMAASSSSIPLSQDGTSSYNGDKDLQHGSRSKFNTSSRSKSARTTNSIPKTTIQIRKVNPNYKLPEEICKGFKDLGIAVTSGKLEHEHPYGAGTRLLCLAAFLKKIDLNNPNNEIFIIDAPSRLNNFSFYNYPWGKTYSRAHANISFLIPTKEDSQPRYHSRLDKFKDRKLPFPVYNESPRHSKAILEAVYTGKRVFLYSYDYYNIDYQMLYTMFANYGSSLSIYIGVQNFKGFTGEKFNGETVWKKVVRETPVGSFNYIKASVNSSDSFGYSYTHKTPNYYYQNDSVSSFEHHHIAKVNQITKEVDLFNITFNENFVYKPDYIPTLDYDNAAVLKIVSTLNTKTTSSVVTDNIRAQLIKYMRNNYGNQFYSDPEIADAYILGTSIAISKSAVQYKKSMVGSSFMNNIDELSVYDKILTIGKLDVLAVATLWCKIILSISMCLIRILCPKWFQIHVLSVIVSQVTGMEPSPTTLGVSQVVFISLVLASVYYIIQFIAQSVNVVRSTYSVAYNNSFRVALLVLVFLSLSGLTTANATDGYHHAAQHEKPGKLNESATLQCDINNNGSCSKCKFSNTTFVVGFQFNGTKPEVPANCSCNEHAALEYRQLMHTQNDSVPDSVAQNTWMHIATSIKNLIGHSENAIVKGINETSAMVNYLNDNVGKLYNKSINYNYTDFKMNYTRWLSTRQSYNMSKKINITEARNSLKNVSLEYYDYLRNMFVKRENNLPNINYYENKTLVPRCIQGMSDRLVAYKGPFFAGYCEHFNKILTIEDGFHPVLYASGHSAEYIGSWAQFWIRKFQSVSHSVTFLSNDASRFDTHLSHKTFRAFRERYWKDIMPKQLLKSMENVVKTKGYGRHGHKYTINGTRCSGDSETSIENTIINLGFHYSVFDSLGLRIGIDYVMAASGDDNFVVFSGKIDTEIVKEEIEYVSHKISMKWKPLFSDHLYDTDFLSALFVPNSKGNLVLTPKPGRIIARLGTRPYSHQVNRLDHNKTVAIGLQGTAGVNPLVQALLSRPEYNSGNVDEVFLKSFCTYKTIACREHASGPETYRFFANRYGVSVTEIKDLSDKIEFGEFELGESNEPPSTLKLVFEVDC